ncbi:uncharacterized protein At2g24330 [Castanea sativa]|uniref:uncharacterized protein At2g24330 n=1 Tax=Castanea sativa TaxID=21020 RepID=UPI003F652E1F
MAEDKGIGEGENKDASTSTAAAAATTDGNDKKKTQRQGILSRVWKGIFRLHGDDFEKRLQYISKEEAAVVARLKRRSYTWRRMTRNLIVISVILEVIAIGYAIMTTRSTDLDWKMRAFRIFPMFLLPALSSASYSAFVSFTRMCNRKDEKTLDRLRAERKAKIDELKEKTNYYTTQQLIQRYDTDPAAKAAAATVLASKLGADSGLNIQVGDESKLKAPTGKSSDVELVQSGGLRNRKQVLPRSNSMVTSQLHHSDGETAHSEGTEVDPRTSEHNQLVVSHHSHQGSATIDGGWIARIAAMLVGEDPTQSYALICGNCHMHNGLARKEDFPYITYYCPHCHALNRPNQSEAQVSGLDSPNLGSLRTQGSGDVMDNARVSGPSTPNLGSLRTQGTDDSFDNASGSASESGLTSNNTVRAGSEIEEVTKGATSEHIDT